jgi:ATP-dependent RNA helicase DDX3X
MAIGRVGSNTYIIVQKVQSVLDTNKSSHLMDLIHAQKAEGMHGKQYFTLVFVDTQRGVDALEY